MFISICIPTRNRPEHLLNCLNSISLQTKKNFEVCISDNCSKQNIKKIIKPYRNKLKFKFRRNKTNLGFAVNLLKVSDMASGDFTWFLGDDDLLIPTAIEELTNIITRNKTTDFFWVNSFYLKFSYLQKFKSPFHTKYLPKNMGKHSMLTKDKKLKFFELFDKKISFDYLVGIYVCVFRTIKWKKNLHVIDKKLISDVKPWSNFENTCFFIKVFCAAFKKSKVYFCSKPLSVNLSEVREWNNLYSFVEIVRIPEVLDYCRSEGMKFFPYLINKNYALRNFFNYFVKILIKGEKSGLKYINFKKHFFYNLIYPNSWLSLLYYLFRNLKTVKKNFLF